MKTEKLEKCINYQKNSILKVLDNMTELCQSTHSENPEICKNIIAIEKDLINAHNELRGVTNDLFTLIKNAADENQDTVTISVIEMIKYVSKLIAII
ncbi:MAG: hypothetical protein SOU07_06950 [Bacilli bacterium]|nr:hypothetical protein [Bacilli bacterium]